MVRLATSHYFNVGPRCAVEWCIGNAAHWQEVRSQPSHAELGHVGQWLANTTSKQEAPQLLVQAWNVYVPHKGLRADTVETHPITLAEGDLDSDATWESQDYMLLYNKWQWGDWYDRNDEDDEYSQWGRWWWCHLWWVIHLVWLLCAGKDTWCWDPHKWSLFCKDSVPLAHMQIKGWKLSGRKKREKNRIRPKLSILNPQFPSGWKYSLKVIHGRRKEE